ncbi:hypothetical protein ACLOJK_036874, partial [Asimina triloba]
MDLPEEDLLPAGREMEGGGLRRWIRDRCVMEACWPWVDLAAGGRLGWGSMRRAAMAHFLPDEMKMELLLDLMGPDLDHWPTLLGSRTDEMGHRIWPLDAMENAAVFGLLGSGLGKQAARHR